MVKGKKTIDEKRMPFLDHLEELRWRLIKSSVAIAVGCVICYGVSGQLMAYLTKPFPKQLVFLSPAEGFMVRLKVSLFGGLVLALPVVFYQLWQFVAPGLVEKERRYVPSVVLISTFSFVLGAAFAYLVIVPLAIQFFLGFESANLVATIRVNEYLAFVTNMMLASGVVFEMPLLSFFLGRLGLLTPRFLRSKRPYAVVAILTIAAILTPPDVLSQILLAAPMILLYEVSIWTAGLAARWGKRRRKPSN
ncbi:MAG: twin-arginine translocase subunit TatC [candidate division KSB1 bacterium]|nr:twin-arginine translocase subunit TatC [candidate division KSB1 bacterium]